MIILGAVFVLCFGLGSSKVLPKRQTGYVDCQPGTLNIILAAPHGGDEQPSDIPDRDAGCWISGGCVYSHDCGSKDFDRCSATTVKDMHTRELTGKMADELNDLFGERPTIVLNLLHRIKLDANRDLDEASFGEPDPEAAWYEFHECIDNAKAEIEDSGEMGLFFDIHGHGHSIQWAEMGYRISGSDLDSGNPINPATTSIRNLADHSSLDFDELLRGSTSFGDYVEMEGYESVPSTTNPGPDGNSYFSGGYNTERHGSIDGTSTIDGIQIESARTPRDDWDGDYGPALARAIHGFYTDHYPTQSD